MEFQHTEAPQEGAPTELAQVSHLTRRDLFRANMRRLVASGPVMRYAHNSLKAIRAANQHLSRCPEQEFKAGLAPDRALATRATLELIRLELLAVERQILRAELVHLEQQREKQQREKQQRQSEESE